MLFNENVMNKIDNLLLEKSYPNLTDPSERKVKARELSTLMRLSKHETRLSKQFQDSSRGAGKEVYNYLNSRTSNPYKNVLKDARVGSK